MDGFGSAQGPAAGSKWTLRDTRTQEFPTPFRMTGRGSWNCCLRAQARRATKYNWLLMLDVPECEINPWLSNVWLFGDLVLKVFLGFARHNQQAPVGQPFCKGTSSILPFETK
jgi:hypothetical protein